MPMLTHNRLWMKLDTVDLISLYLQGHDLAVIFTISGGLDDGRQIFLIDHK